MLRFALMALLAMTTVASAQQQRRPLTIFDPGGVTVVQPAPGGFFANDTRGNMAIGNGGLIAILPAPVLPAPQAQPRGFGIQPLSIDD